jgi:hypothetical protein
MNRISEILAGIDSAPGRSKRDNSLGLNQARLKPHMASRVRYIRFFLRIPVSEFLGVTDMFSINPEASR